MSPRAAWRLITLGFPTVYDYVDGKADWFAAGGAREEAHLREINTYAEAGYEHVYVHQIGPDQEGFFRFYERQVLPKLSR